MDQGPPNPNDSPAPSAAPPLSPEHHAVIVRAQRQRKKLNRAIGVANFNAWSFAILGGFSVLLAVFSPGSLIASVLLGGLAYNEFRGRRQLKQLDQRGPHTLGWNQVICCVLIIGYCALRIYQATTGPGVYETVIEDNPELANMLEPMEGLMQQLTIATYAAVLILGVGLQGLTAWYYFSRQRLLNAYLEQTPGWVLDLERVQAGAG